jgi:DNA-binding transcriptional regulator PaaX
MRGEITLSILNVLAEATNEAARFASYFFTDFTTSYSRLRGFRTTVPKKFTPEERRSVEKQRFYLMLSKLKREGFIEKQNHEWRLTKHGMEKRRTLLEKRARAFPIPTYQAGTSSSSEFKIIMFDVPERERRKRAWLRSALRTLGFTPLQKSVWGGNRSLPKAFFEHLEAMKLLSYVEILAVTKRGTLKSLA